MIINTNFPKKRNYYMDDKDYSLKKKKSKKKFPKFKVPTFKEVENMVFSIKSPLYPAYIYGFFKNRNWRYPNGTKVKSVREMVEYLTKIYYSGFGLPPIMPIYRKGVKHIKKKLSYKEQLKDPRWLAFREKVFKIKGMKCEHCNSTFNLQIHHPKYKENKMAWEYSINEVVVLCRKCHVAEHNLEE